MKKEGTNEEVSEAERRQNVFSGGFMGSDTLWAWLIWSSVAVLMAPTVIFILKLEIDDLRATSRSQARPHSHIEDAEHRKAA